MPLPCRTTQVDGVPRAAMDELYTRPTPEITQALAASQDTADKLVRAVEDQSEASDSSKLTSIFESVAVGESPMHKIRQEWHEGEVDPDAVLGDDGYLLPGRFVNVIESVEAMAKREAHNAMLKQLHYDVERKAEKDARRRARMQRRLKKARQRKERAERKS